MLEYVCMCVCADLQEMGVSVSMLGRSWVTGCVAVCVYFPPLHTFLLPNSPSPNTTPPLPATLLTVTHFPPVLHTPILNVCMGLYYLACIVCVCVSRGSPRLKRPHAAVRTLII